VLPGDKKYDPVKAEAVISLSPDEEQLMSSDDIVQWLQLSVEQWEGLSQLDKVNHLDLYKRVL